MPPCDAQFGSCDILARVPIAVLGRQAELWQDMLKKSRRSL